MFCFHTYCYSFLTLPNLWITFYYTCGGCIIIVYIASMLTLPIVLGFSLVCWKSLPIRWPTVVSVPFSFLVYPMLSLNLGPHTPQWSSFSFFLKVPRSTRRHSFHVDSFVSSFTVDLGLFARQWALRAGKHLAVSHLPSNTDDCCPIKGRVWESCHRHPANVSANNMGSPRDCFLQGVFSHTPPSALGSGMLNRQGK